MGPEGAASWLAEEGMLGQIVLQRGEYNRHGRDPSPKGKLSR